MLMADHYSGESRADIKAATGCEGALRSVVAQITEPKGIRSGYDGVKLREELDKIKAANQWAVIWMAPNPSKLDRHEVDLDALPHHADVADAMDAIADHGDLCVIRILFEFANRCQGADGKFDGTFHYGSPQQYIAMFEAIAAQRPANALASWDYEPSANVDFTLWKPPSAQVGGLDTYGRKTVDPTTAKGKHALKFLGACAAWGLPTAHFEAGCTDVADICTTGDAMARDQFFKRYAKMIYGAGSLAAEITSFGWGGFTAILGWLDGRWAKSQNEPWPGAPLTTAYMKKWLTSPVVTKMQKNPIEASGLAKNL